jgi:hypothetical protein
MSNEEEFYKEYYKYFSGDTDNIYQFKGYNNNFYQSKKKTEKSNKKLKFGSEGAIVKYSAFEVQLCLSILTSSSQMAL